MERVLKRVRQPAMTRRGDSPSPADREREDQLREWILQGKVFVDFTPQPADSFWDSDGRFKRRIDRLD